MDQLKAMLNKSGVYMSTLRGQIAAQIAWSKTVQGRYGGDVNVTPADVDAEMKRLAESADKPRFRVSEIFMPVDSPEEADKVKKDMEELETQIQLGAPFPAVARQFSQNPTAAQGGDLGWVLARPAAAGTRQGAADDAARQIVPQPIRAAGGYYILALRAREEPEGTKLPDADQAEISAGRPAAGARAAADRPHAAQEAAAARRCRRPSVIRANIHNCAHASGAWSAR